MVPLVIVISHSISTVFLPDYWHNHMIKAHPDEIMFLDLTELTMVATMLVQEIKKELA